jgi:hypothetical protein
VYSWKCTDGKEEEYRIGSERALNTKLPHPQDVPTCPVSECNHILKNYQPGTLISTLLSLVVLGLHYMDMTS